MRDLQEEKWVADARRGDTAAFESLLRRYEKRVLALSRKALLSTAELVKCVEAGVTDFASSDQVIDALYNDEDTTSENISYLMLHANSRASVTLAVANLCLGKQIIFERV